MTMEEKEGLAAAHKLIDLSDPITTAEERKEAHAAMDAMAAMAKAEKANLKLVGRNVECQ